MKAPLGRLIYRFNLPLIRMALKSSYRVRVLVEAEGEFLLLKNIISRQQWMLPGGGIGKHEQPVEAAIRELKEEVGVLLSAQQLELIDKFEYFDEQANVSWRVVILSAKLLTKPTINPRPSEILDYIWAKPDNLPKPHSSLVAKMLSTTGL